MGNPNSPNPSQNNQYFDEKTLPPKVQRQLSVLKDTQVIFSMLDLVPSEASWFIKLSDMERYVQEIAGKMLGPDEVKYVTIDGGRSVKVPRARIWLHKDSRHLVDRSKSSQTSNMAVAVTVTRFSEDLKKFADQFAPRQREDGTLISRKKLIDMEKGGKHSSDLRAIKVDLTRIIERLFDVGNRGFLDTYGPNAANKRCSVVCKISYGNSNSGNPYIDYIKVTKFVEGSKGRRDFRPVLASFQDRRDRNRDRDDDDDTRDDFYNSITKD